MIICEHKDGSLSVTITADTEDELLIRLQKAVRELTQHTEKW